MPEIPFRRQESRIATPEIIRNQDPDVLESEQIAAGLQDVASAASNVFLRLAKARTNAAANHAMSQITGVLNDAQQAANESTDFANMGATFETAYEEALPGILEGIPDDGTRFEINEAMNRQFMTRQASVRQRALSLERDDHLAKFDGYSTEIARMIESTEPNSLTLTDSLDTWLEALEDEVIFGSMDPAQAEARRTKMLEFQNIIEIRELVLNKNSLVAIKAMAEPGSFPHLTAETRVKIDEALRVQDNQDAVAQMEELVIAGGQLQDGELTFIDGDGKVQLLEVMADDLWLQNRFSEQDRTDMILRIKKARAAGNENREIAALGKSLGVGVGKTPYNASPKHKKAGNAEWHASVDEWFNGPDPDGQLRVRSSQNIAAHAAKFMNDRGFIPPEGALFIQGMMNSQDPEQMYASAQVYVMGTSGNSQKQAMMGWTPENEHLAEEIIRLGLADPSDRTRVVNEVLTIRDKLLTESGVIRQERFNELIAEPDIIRNLIFEHADDMTMEVMGVGEVDFGTILAGGFEIGNEVEEIPWNRFPPELISTIENFYRVEFMRTGNKHSSGKVALSRAFGPGQWGPTREGGRPRFERYPIERTVQSIDGSHEWYRRQMLRGVALRMGLYGEKVFENANIAKARNIARGVDDLIGDYKSWVRNMIPVLSAIGAPTEELEKLGETIEGSPEMAVRFMDSLAGYGPPPHAWSVTKPGPVRNGKPERWAMYVNGAGDLQVTRNADGTPWVIDTDLKASPEWIDHLKRDSVLEAAGIKTTALARANEIYEATYGETPLQTLGIPAGYNGNNSTLSKMTEPEKADMRALVQANNEQLEERFERARVWAANLGNDQREKRAKTRAETGGIMRIPLDLGIAVFEGIGNALTGGAITNWLNPGGLENDMGSFGMDPSFNEYVDQIQQENARQIRVVFDEESDE